MTNNNYTINQNKYSNDQLIELARELLPEYRDGRKLIKNTYECPICGGKLYIRKANDRMSCVSNNCKGIYNEVRKLAGDWIDWDAIKQRKEDRERERQWERDRERERLAKQRKALDTLPAPGTGLSEKHYQDFDGSGISREIADLNYIGLSDNNFIANLLAWGKYKHTPGHFAPGVDVATGKIRTDLKGQLKPDIPFSSPKQRKPSKYLTTKYGYDAIAMICPGIDWGKVLADITIPIFVTEGSKKALKYMIETGKPALALPGVEMFLDGDDLLPTLKLLAVPGREFHIGYDSDYRNNGNVSRAMTHLSEKLTEATNTETKIVDWDPVKGKGIDDALKAGAELIYTAFSEWQQLQKLKLVIDGETKQLSPAETTPSVYKGDVLTITDRYDLPAPALVIPSFFDRENSSKLIDQVTNYRRLGCHSFYRLPMDKLRDLAKGNNIRTSLNKSEVIDKLVRLTGVDRTELEGKTSEQLKDYAKENGIKNLFGINSCELAERLELSGVSKDGLSFKDNLTLTIKIDHPNGGYIASLIESLNDLDDPKYDINLPFDLIKEGQYLNHKKAVRNDPSHMNYSATFTNWKQARKFTPDKITHFQYLSDSELKNINIADGNIHAIKSGLGTGKTKLMIDLAKTFNEQYPDHNLMIVSYRNGLVFNTVSKMKTENLPMKESKDFKDNIGYIKKSENAWVGFCCDSFLDIDVRMYKQWEKKTIFIFDEVDSVVNHILFSSTMKEKRIPIIKRLLECLRASAGILTLSGTLNNTCLKFFCGIEKDGKIIGGIGKNLIKYENITDRPKIPVRWILGSSGDIETDILQIKEKDNYKIVDNLTARLKNNENCIASSDSQAQCERLHLYYEKIFDGKKKILRIDRKTRSEDKTSPFIDGILRNPKRIAELGYDLLIYNSSAESGVDISFDKIHNNYFSHHFHFGYGIVSIDSNIQLLRRYRGGCPLTVWMVPTSRNKVALLQGDDLKYDRMTRMIESGMSEESQPDDYICDLADELAYLLAYEKSNLRQCMLQALSDHGYEIEYIVNDETDTNLSEETKARDEKYANEVFNADPKFIDVDISELKRTKEDEQQSWSNQLAETKAFYFREFGYSRENHDNGEHELFTVENIIAIEKYNGSFFEKVKNHIYIDLSKDDLKLLQLKKYSGDFSNPIFYRDVRRVVLPLTAIKKSGLSELLKVKTIGTDDPIFNKIRAYAKSHPNEWKVLANGEYSEKWFFSQVKSILDSRFGVTLKRVKDLVTIDCSELILATIEQVENRILEKLEKIKSETIETVDIPIEVNAVEVETPAVVVEVPPAEPQPIPEPAPVVTAEPVNNVIEVDDLEKLVMPATNQQILHDGKIFIYYYDYDNRPTWKSADHTMISFSPKTRKLAEVW